MQLVGTLRTRHPPGMEPPPWLSDLLELAELLIRLGERDDVAHVLEQLKAGELTLPEAIRALRQLH